MAVSALSGKALRRCRRAGHYRCLAPSPGARSAVERQSRCMTNFRIRRVGNLGNIPDLRAGGWLVRRRRVPFARDFRRNRSVRSRSHRNPARTAEHAVRQEHDGRRDRHLHRAAERDLQRQRRSELSVTLEGGARTRRLTQFKASLSGPLDRHASAPASVRSYTNAGRDAWRGARQQRRAGQRHEPLFGARPARMGCHRCAQPAPDPRRRAGGRQERDLRHHLRSRRSLRQTRAARVARRRHQRHVQRQRSAQPDHLRATSR